MIVKEEKRSKSLMFHATILPTCQSFVASSDIPPCARIAPAHSVWCVWVGSVAKSNFL